MLAWSCAPTTVAAGFLKRGSLRGLLSPRAAEEECAPAGSIVICGDVLCQLSNDVLFVQLSEL